MRAPLPDATGSRGLLRGLVLAVVTLLVATLLGPAQNLAAAAPTGPASTPAPVRSSLATTGGTDDPAATTAPRLTVDPASRAARSSATRDTPKLPSQCFGPGRSRIEPFPCPLNWQRKGQPIVLLWGDSHAYQWIPGFVEAVKGQRVNLVSMVAGSCPPVLVQTDPGARQCKRSNWNAYKYVRQLLRQRATFKVVLGSNWSGFRRGYRAMVLEGAGGPPTGYVEYTRQMVEMAHEGTPALFDKLGALGVDVDILGQAAVVPERRPACPAGDDPYLCDVQRWRAIPEEYGTLTYLRHQQAKIARRGESRIIDATPGYCTADVCRGRVGSVQTYFDDLHLSATRTRNLARYLVPSVRAVRR